MITPQVKWSKTEAHAEFDRINPKETTCAHCKGPIAIRNPKGFCDHLYYPENCETCKKAKEAT